MKLALKNSLYFNHNNVYNSFLLIKNAIQTYVFSFDFKAVLIPKGSKFVCTFEPLQAYGETALNVLDLSTKFLEKIIDLAPVVSIPNGTRIILKIQVDVNLQPVDAG